MRNDIDKDELIQIADQISVEGSELVMTIADKIREEGKLEGRQEEIRKVVKNAIVKRMDLEDIMDLTGLTEGEIDNISKEMLQR